MSSFANRQLPQPQLCDGEGCERPGTAYTLKDGSTVYRCPRHKPRTLGGRTGNLNKGPRRERDSDAWYDGPMWATH